MRIFSTLVRNCSNDFTFYLSGNVRLSQSLNKCSPKTFVCAKTVLYGRLIILSQLIKIKKLFLTQKLISYFIIYNLFTLEIEKSITSLKRHKQAYTETRSITI